MFTPDPLFAISLSFGPPWIRLPVALVLGFLFILALMAIHVGRLNRRLSKQLQWEESRLRAITQALPDLVAVLDEDGYYRELYAHDESHLIAPRNELLGHTVFECLPLDIAELTIHALRGTLATQELITIEVELKTQAGKRWLESRFVAMDREMNGKRCVLLMNRDISEQKHQEEHVRQSQRLASLGVLAGGIAHDFNNMLMAMRGHLDLATTNLEQNASPNPSLKQLEVAIKRASELSGKILSYSCGTKFRIESYDLNSHVEEMVQLLQIAISKKVDLRLCFQPRLPVIQADPAQIQQVIMNLVMNASDAIGDQEGSITLSTSMVVLTQSNTPMNFPKQGLEPGRYLALEVRDTGCGISPNIIKQIFDPLFTTKNKGRGLGLSALLGILRGHRAGIQIQSSPGCGSSFIVFLPISPARADLNPKVPSRIHQMGGAIA